MKRYLVCLDASPRAAQVLATAVELGRQTGGKLSLFRAVGVPPELPPRLYTMSPNQLPALLLDEAQKELTALAATVPADLLDEIFTHVGSPWSGICEAARTHKADLIAIGSHGHGALDRLLGTTASKVVNHADCSVLIVRSAGDDR